jgi:hypothetical protein
MKMKKTILSAVLAVLMLAGFSQEKKETSKAGKQLIVPIAVKKTFTTQFPKAAKVKWSIEKPGEYEAEFVLNKTEMSAAIDEKGFLLETESEIKESDLPQAIKTTLAKDFAGYKTGEIVKADAKGTVTYEMEARKDKKNFEIIFASTGKFLTKKELKNGDEKD